METTQIVERNPWDFSYPAFDGFPYISVQLLGDFPHLTLLPQEMPPPAMKQLALFQAFSNQMEVYLGLPGDLCFHINPDGTAIPETRVPAGGCLECDRLLLAVDIPETPELLLRKTQLEDFKRKLNRNVTSVRGDPHKDGRLATRDEIQMLAGRQPNGAPKGLQKCAHCGEWKGECLDPDRNLRHLLMRVCCLCDNHNRCARCGQLLFHRKLNANYYSNTDGRIWYVPGFFALEHTCNTDVAWNQ